MLRFAPVRAWPLHRRLLVIMAVMLVVLSTIVGAASAIALRHSLLERLDEQVLAGLRFGGWIDGGILDPSVPLPEGIEALEPPEGFEVPEEFDDGPQRRVGSLTVVVVDGAVTVADYVDVDGTVATLDSEQQDALLDTIEGLDDSTPVSVDLGGELGEFRVAAASGSAATGDAVTLVSGSSTAEVTATVTSLVAIFAGVGAAAVLLAVLVGAPIIRRSLRPLERVADTATRVAARPLSAGAVDVPERVPEADTDERTEVGKVGAALNTLLGHVETSLRERERGEQRLRQFVADASHELRTPLASIRGYAELTLGSDRPLDEGHRAAIDRIESESLRMSSLVDDLLLLARLDAGQPLRHERVDLAMLLVDAVSDAHVAGREHDWVLEVPDEGVEVTGDPARLQQVIANLLANARVHTPAGTTVTASVAVDGVDAVLEVVDTGPGIDPAVRDTLFERFARGDDSRSRESGSSGLGLSIVSAIVAAHGGELTAGEAEPGGSRPGARFTVRLPLARQQHPAP